MPFLIPSVVYRGKSLWRRLMAIRAKRPLRFNYAPDLPRVLLLGLDGAPPEIVFDNPDLPNLQRLLQRASYGPLTTVFPPVTAPAWVSMYTGKSPSNHGIVEFSIPQRCTQCGYGPEFGKHYNLCPRCGAKVPKKLVSARDIRGKRLWDILGQHNISSGVMNVPVTWSNPLLPLKGWLISGMLTPTNRADYAYPSQLKAEALQGYLIDVLGQERIGKLINTNQPLDKEIVYQAALRVTHNRARYLKKLIRDYPTNFVFAVFTSPDRLMHVAWREPLLPAYWRELDQVLGDLFAFLETEGFTHIFIASDHGFCDREHEAARPHLDHCGIPGPNHQGVHSMQGIFVAAGDGIRQNHRLQGEARILDVAPTILRVFGLDAPDDMDGHVLNEIFTAVPERIGTVGPVGTPEEEAQDEGEERAYTPEEEAEIREKLRSLGYLG